MSLDVRTRRVAVGSRGIVVASLSQDIYSRNGGIGGRAVDARGTRAPTQLERTWGRADEERILTEVRAGAFDPSSVAFGRSDSVWLIAPMPRALPLLLGQATSVEVASPLWGTEAQAHRPALNARSARAGASSVARHAAVPATQPPRKCGGRLWVARIFNFVLPDADMRIGVLLASSGAFLLAAAAGAPAWAEGFMPEHGKVNTGDATPVGENQVEVEMSYSPSRAVQNGWGSFEDSALAREHLFALAVTWGPSDNLDFRAETGYGYAHEGGDQSRHGHGHTDGSLGARCRFLALGQLDLAVTTSLTLPTGEHGASNRLPMSQLYYSWGATLVASADAGRATGNLELGHTLPMGEERGRERGTSLANLAVGYHFLDWLQPEAELNFEHGFAKGGPDANQLAVTLGLVVPWGDGHRITAGVQQAVWGQHCSAFTAGSIAYKAAF